MILAIPCGMHYQENCCDGALNDLDSHAISAGTVLLKEQPRKNFCQINNRRESGVEIAFSITAVYSEGRSMVGHFGFDTDYENTLYIRRYDKTVPITVPPADCFTNFFHHIFTAYTNRQFNDLYNHLLLHVKSLDMLKHAAEKEKNCD